MSLERYFAKQECTSRSMIIIGTRCKMYQVLLYPYPLSTRPSLAMLSYRDRPTNSTQTIIMLYHFIVQTGVLPCYEYCCTHDVNRVRCTSTTAAVYCCTESITLLYCIDFRVNSRAAATECLTYIATSGGGGGERKWRRAIPVVGMAGAGAAAAGGGAAVAALEATGVLRSTK